MQKKLFKIILFGAIAQFASAQEIDISQGWKFKQGDNLEWAKPEFNDADWKSIEVGRTWELQGYEKYDGYGWYRYKVFLPSSLKKNATRKDSIKFCLGIIDDHDQFYLNGTKIAENAGMKFIFGNTDNSLGNSAYYKERKYVVSVQNPALKWDKENIISIRVFDQIGNGGIREGKKFAISMVDDIDDISIDINTYPYKFRSNNTISKTISLTVLSSSGIDFKGKLLVEAIDVLTKEVKASYSIVAELNNKKPFDFEFSLPSNEDLLARYSYIDLVSGNGISITQEVPFILTPPEKPEPKINASKVFGSKPGSPILFTVATSGERPMVFSAENLPQGLNLDPNTGFVTGTLNAKNEYLVKFTAKNAKGTDMQTIKFICGDLITLTPQMGWNSWNCWGLAISDEKVRASANAMIEKGLINYGWSYVNIDDGWENKRDANKILQPNEKFPDMKKLCEDIHNMGLKIGIYSSPGPQTCGKFEGSYGNEQIDATTWANWGIDYLKYDLCSYSDLPIIRKNLVFPKNAWQPLFKTKKDTALMVYPYIVMQKCLANCKRDIVYSLCQYGLADVWKWGAKVNSQSWRTTGDIEDSWTSVAEIGLNQAPLAAYAKPGRWNDPDMLVVGKVGWGPKLRSSRLSFNEQYTHISLWAMLASPLLIGCDMSQLDDFTLNLLKNSEVIAINQDPLGKQAIQKLKNENFQVWLKELEDGSKAIAIINVSEKIQNVSIDFKTLGITSIKKIRDVWRQKDLQNNTIFDTVIPKHGLKLLKIN